MRRLRRLIRRGCPRPPWREASLGELRAVSLPPKERVLARLNEVISDDTVKLVIRDLVDAIYSLPEDSEFMEWLKTNAIRYRVYTREDKMVDFILVSTLAFIDYCNEKLGGIEGKNLIDPAEIGEPACAVVESIAVELKAAYQGVTMSKAQLARAAFRWKREVSKLKKLWDTIEREWCKW